MIRETLICVILVYLAGCAAAPKNHYYFLSAEASTESGSGARSQPVSPVRALLILPGITDRPQLVVRIDKHSVEIRELDRWAEPFDQMAQRVLNEDLMARTVSLRDLPGGAKHTRHIVVNIDEFIADIDGAAHLSGYWQDIPPLQLSGNGPVSSFSLSEPLVDHRATSVVTAMSALLDKLAGLIALDTAREAEAASRLPGPSSLP